MIKECLQCGKEFKTILSHIKKGRGKYCSKECYWKNKKGKPSGKTGWNKGLKGYVNTGSFLKGIIPWNKGKHGIYSIDFRKKLSFCAQNRFKGKSLSEKHRKKISEEHIFNRENRHTWKGGITPINELIRKSLKYRFWREAVYKRDDYICQICDKHGSYLIANHIKKFADCPELRFEVNNGITVCKDCNYRLVNFHEPEWESYFNFNLMTRGYLKNEFYGVKC